MTKITALTGAVASAIEDEMVAACQGVAEKYGVSITRLGGGSFTAANFKVNIQVATIGEDGSVATREAEDFKRYCHRYELEESDLNKVFIDLADSERYEIVGCKPRSTKFPLLVKRLSNGKRYKFPAARAKRALDALAEA